jgi:hypothetical protein
MQNRTCLIILVVLALAGVLILCLGAVVLGAFGFLIPGRATVSEATITELAAGTPAILTVQNKVGEVNIVAGQDGSIRIEAEKEARGRDRGRSQELLNAIRVRIVPEGEAVRVAVDLPPTGPNENVKVDLQIQVPHRTNLDILNRVGEVNVEGVRGNLVVRNDVGSVVLRDVDVAGEAEVETGTGDVEFTGRLPENQGRVLLNSRVGGLQVRIPASSRFVLDAETNLGSIEASFVVDDGQGSGGSDRGLGHRLQGNVNGGEGVDLVLRSGTGSISLRPIE